MSARRSCTRATSLLLIVLIPRGSASAMGQTRSAPDQTLEAALRPGITCGSPIRPAGTSTRAWWRVTRCGHDIIGRRVRHTRVSDVVRVSAPQSDPILNGALIGVGVAVASGLFLCTRTEPRENCRDDAGPVARMAALGAAIGIGIDALVRGRETIYEAGPAMMRPRITPIAAERACGLQVTVGF